MLAPVARLSAEIARDEASDVPNRDVAAKSGDLPAVRFGRRLLQFPDQACAASSTNVETKVELYDPSP